MQEAKTIKLLSPLLRYYPWGIPIIVGLGFLSSLFEGLGISLFIPLLQSLEQGNGQLTSDNVLIRSLNQLFANISPDYRFLIITIGIFGSIVLKNSLSYSNGAVFSLLNSKISHRLRSGIFQQYLHVNYGFLEQFESGKLINILATETWQTSRALAVIVSLMTSICTITVFVVLLLLLSWRLTLLVALFMVAISMTIRFLTRQVQELGKQAVEVNSFLTTRMWEGLTGMRMIRAFGREAYEQERFDHTSEQVRTTFFKLELLSNTVAPLSEVLAALMLLCILAIALWQDRAALPTLLTFIFILYRLQPQVKQLDGSRLGLVSLASSVNEVMTMLDRTNKPYIHSGHLPFEGLKQAIALESVTFHYNALEKPALQDISLCIPKGKTTALVGPSGAGKSTLIGLICRFYEVNDGKIEVDGCPLPSFDLKAWRDRIAIVSQDVYLFSATVRENIAYGRLDATDEDIIDAAKQANAHDFICQLPLGYDTKVGDRGVRLSGGQRQRIALARAIVRNPDILILDEATNALDSIAEQLIQDALESFGRDRTVIVIAHRLSTIEQADQIIVLQDGRVIEQGDLAQLLSLDGLFAQLYRLQYRNAQI